MKKRVKKLALAKETLCELDFQSLEKAVGESGWICWPQLTSMYCTQTSAEC